MSGRNNRRAGRVAVAVLAVAAVSVGSFLWFAEADGDDGASSADVTDPAETAASSTTVALATDETSLASAETAPESYFIGPGQVGKPSAELIASLGAIGVTPTVTEQPSKEPPGTVLSVSPSSAEVRSGDEVSIVISIAPTILPTVTLMSDAAAASVLEPLGVSITRVYVLAEDWPAGTVVSQTPVGESSFSPSVTLEVSFPGVTTYLTDMDWVAHDGAGYGAFTVDGTVFPRSVGVLTNPRSSPMFVEYNLGHKALRLRGTLGISDDEPSTMRSTVRIFADGLLVFEGTVGLGDSIDIDIDITNCLRLRIENNGLTEDRGWTVLGDLRVVAQTQLSSE